MTHHVYTMTDPENRVCGVGIIPGVVPPCPRQTTLTLTPYTFETEEAAQVYRDQLADYYGLTTGRPPATVKVVCNETGEEWPTVAEAVRAARCAYSQMINHINGKPGYKTVKGQTYRRASVPTIPGTVEKLPVQTEGVICWQLPPHNNRFATVAQAAREFGVHPSQIFRHLKDPRKYPDVKGRTFARIGEDGRPIMPG